MARLVHRFTLTLSVMLLCLACPVALAASRGIAVTLKTSDAPNAPDGKTVELYSESYALVIGQNDYTNGFPKLTNAVKDAELVAATLKQKGFQILLYKNLDSTALQSVFHQFFIIQGDTPSARLFVWYAGHGATVDGDSYLVPTDAPPPTDEQDFKLKALNMRAFDEFMAQARSKHVFAVFDSCFSGGIFEMTRGAPPPAITLDTTKPVREVLTSGSDKQEVSDDGLFRRLFIDALDGDTDADANHDGYLTASELGSYMEYQVTNRTHGKQTPWFAKMRDMRYDEGDFVFLMPNQGANSNPVASAPAGDTSAELEFWKTVQSSSNDPKMYDAYLDAYLKQYPNGNFAVLAKLKKAELEADSRKHAAPAAAPVQTPMVAMRSAAPAKSKASPAAADEASKPSAPTSTPATQPTASVPVAAAPATASSSTPKNGTLTLARATQVQVAPPGPSPVPQAPAASMPDTRQLIQHSSLDPLIKDRMLTYLKLADAGNVSAQFSLGYMFDKGELIAANKPEAVAWYRKAARQGNSEAQVDLAIIYETGANGVPKDLSKAIGWYQKAATGGNPDAQEKLAYFYEHGLGLPKDPATAARLYRSAAEQGKMTAQNNLGRLYQLGNGVKQDKTQAIYWYKKAAEQGSQAAKANLDRLGKL